METGAKLKPAFSTNMEKNEEWSVLRPCKIFHIILLESENYISLYITINCLNCFCINCIASVISLIYSLTQSGLARSLFMTRSRVILFSFCSVYVKSVFQMYETFSFRLKLSRLGKKTDFTVIFQSKLGLCKWGHFEKVLHNNDARKAANFNDPNFSILFWIIGVFR